MSYAIGQKYSVLAVLIGKPHVMSNGDTVTLDNYRGFKGWLPLLNAFALDEDFITTTVPHHVHIDWRFLSRKWFEHFRLTHWAEGLVGSVMTLPAEYISIVKPIKRLMTCRREFPELPAFEWAHWYQPLRRKYACAALKSGKCPHKGTSIEAMIEVDGKLVCPAHGLKWNRLAPHELSE